MLTFIALSAALMQEPPAPPALPVPPVPPEIHTRLMVVGTGGPGGLDRDGDGQVTREEFAAPMNDHFGRMDKDGDGRLSAEELTAGHGSPDEGGEHDLLIMRGPGGPGVRRFEMRRHGPDGGAHVGPGESRTMVFVGGASGAAGEGEIIVHSGPGAPPLMAGHHEGRPGERIEIRRMGGPDGANDLDANNDGRISEAEFSAPMRDAFARMDVDRSGFLEEGERRAGGGAEIFVRRIETRLGGED